MKHVNCNKASLGFKPYSFFQAENTYGFFSGLRPWIMKFPFVDGNCGPFYLQIDIDFYGRVSAEDNCLSCYWVMEDISI